MATGTAGTNARRYHHCMTHYLRKAIAYTNGNGAVITIGTVPAGALIDGGAVTVTTAFNAGTANTLDIGTTGDADGFATLLALGTVGRIAMDELATSNDLYCATDTVITCTLTVSGTAATTGQAIVTVFFTIDNDG
jgi:hypothetical protein